MKNKDWLLIYQDIRRDLGLSEKRDKESAHLLDNFLKTPDISSLKNLIEGRKVNIFGAGPSLELIKKLPKGINIACDGATSFVLSKKGIPHIVVTDLDGEISALIEAYLRGSIMVIHAHGDNMEVLKSYGPLFSRAFGTCQLPPFGKLFSFGGFTDGDRALYMAYHFRPKEIMLYGMDFEGPPGKYSYTPKDRIELKMRKLFWARKFTDELIEEGDLLISYAHPPR